MSINLKFNAYEKKTLKEIDLLQETIDCLVKDEHYSLAQKNIEELREIERFYILTGLKFKDFNYMHSYLNAILGYEYDK